MPYSLYILHSNTLDSYYTGVSKDPRVRLHYHNTQNKGWTKRGRPWELVFIKEYITKEMALKAETFVKAQKSKTFIEKLISNEYTLSK